MSKFVCPECGSNLSLNQTRDWSVNPESGVLEDPSIDNFFTCTRCDWDSLENPAEVMDEIININLENNTL